MNSTTMNSTTKFTAASACIALAALPLLASAQQQTGGWRTPYEGGMRGYAGASIGTSRLDVPCPPGTGCDDSEQALRLYGGGKFNDYFGGEVAWVKLGDFSRGGGEVDSRAIDFALTAGVPFGNNWAVFGKLGAAYTRTQVTATAPGFPTGSSNGWGPRIGAGLQMGLNRNWSIRLDADRYRFKMPQGRENVDVYTIGAQYSFH